MKTYKRPLSSRQAASCEKAKHARCACRCGGVLHGGDHHPYMEAELILGQQEAPLTAEIVARLVRAVAGLPGFEELP